MTCTNQNETALNALKEIIGAALYLDVCAKLAGKSLYIPALREGFTSTAEKRKAIRRDIYGGLSIREAAQRYGLTVSQIYKIMQRRD